MSETDRELLELAAKSSGLERTHYRDGCFCYTTRLGGSVKWNPLTDDGDALRLAVCLELDLELGNFGTIVCLENHKIEEIGGYGCDSMELCRRAIVRAAAEIGKAMNGE